MGLGSQAQISGFNLILEPLLCPKGGVLPVFLGCIIFGFLLALSCKVELVGCICHQIDGSWEVLEVAGRNEADNRVDNTLVATLFFTCFL